MELWDIYDPFKEPTGRTMVRNDWNMKPGEYHLTVQGIISRPDGTFLITQRAASKAWAPLCWEVQGGGVKAGETSKQAVIRELYEETGIDVSGAGGGLFKTYRRDNPDEKDNYFMDVYRFVIDFDPSDVKIDETETCSFALAAREDIIKLAEEGAFMHFDSIRDALGC